MSTRINTIVVIAVALLASGGSRAAETTFEVLTVNEGRGLCVDVAAAPAQYYIRMTASDSEGNESQLSGQVKEDLPGEVCWQNPDQNVDLSSLTDLVRVTVYYDVSPIRILTVRPKTPYVSIPKVVACGGNCATAAVHQSETGQDVVIDWLTTDGPFTLRVLEWPDGTTPVAQANTANNSFTWTPAKAGIYFVTIEGQALTTAGIGHLFYIKLAAPTGGGID